MIGADRLRKKKGAYGPLYFCFMIWAYSQIMYPIS